jgi:hypothetical protein
MERTPEGHYDLVAALWMMCRHLDLFRNPYPPDWDLKPGFIRTRPLPPPVPALKQLLLGGTPIGRKILKGRKKTIPK